MTDFDPCHPFALLWDAQRQRARLFTAPHAIICGTKTNAALAALRDASMRGDWTAGGFSYEAGHQLEPRLTGLEKARPFHWFGCFGPPALLTLGEFGQRLAGRCGPVTLGDPQPLVPRSQWLRAVGIAKAYIAAGDIYQANLTFPAHLPFRGHPLALFARLFAPGAAPHGGLVHDGHGRWWLSFSPELFFRLDAGALLAKPMKGTARRQPRPEADEAAAQALAGDPKNRAENLMITDLIRNDFSRVAVTGSVSVAALQTVETYPSVHQMTSSVTARLRPGLDAVDTLAALFPCGSITGAPKIRAMEVIAELEPDSRGLYCGSLGWIEPGGQSAHFNVAIRTLEIEKGEARLGLGAGIIADSVADDEWEECLLKARFLKPSAPTALIETMRIEEGGGIPRLPFHLARISASAGRFSFALDTQLLEKRLGRLRPATASRLRALLASDGQVALQLSPLPPPPEQPVAVGVVPQPLPATDWRLHHKTNHRAFHDNARRQSGLFEILYENADGLLTEGSYTSLFAERDGQLLTPPQSLGLLPGTLRAELLGKGLAIEANLRQQDLQSGFWIGNSLRGLMRARLC